MYPAQLSGGMQKRTALARALVMDPRIVLFDEPTTGQDPVRRKSILGMIAGLQRSAGFTAVLVSHDMNTLFISNRILFLHDRTILFQGTLGELRFFYHPIKEKFLGSLEEFQNNSENEYAGRLDSSDTECNDTRPAGIGAITAKEPLVTSAL